MTQKWPRNELICHDGGSHVNMEVGGLHSN
jgi:hypothetical protein